MLGRINWTAKLPLILGDSLWLAKLIWTCRIKRLPVSAS